jgi:hypothetical protein
VFPADAQGRAFKPARVSACAGSVLTDDRNVYTVIDRRVYLAGAAPPATVAASDANLHMFDVHVRSIRDGAVMWTLPLGNVPTPTAFAAYAVASATYAGSNPSPFLGQASSRLQPFALTVSGFRRLVVMLDGSTFYPVLPQALHRDPAAGGSVARLLAGGGDAALTASGDIFLPIPMALGAFACPAGGGASSNWIYIFAALASALIGARLILGTAAACVRIRRLKTAPGGTVGGASGSAFGSPGLGPTRAVSELASVATTLAFTPHSSDLTPMLRTASGGGGGGGGSLLGGRGGGTEPLLRRDSDASSDLIETPSAAGRLTATAHPTGDGGGVGAGAGAGAGGEDGAGSWTATGNDAVGELDLDDFCTIRCTAALTRLLTCRNAAVGSRRQLAGEVCGKLTVANARSYWCRPRYATPWVLVSVVHYVAMVVLLFTSTIAARRSIAALSGSLSDPQRFYAQYLINRSPTALASDCESPIAAACFCDMPPGASGGVPTPAQCGTAGLTCSYALPPCAATCPVTLAASGNCAASVFVSTCSCPVSDCSDAALSLNATVLRTDGVGGLPAGLGACQQHYFALQLILDLACVGYVVFTILALGYMLTLWSLVGQVCRRAAIATVHATCPALEAYMPPAWQRDVATQRQQLERQRLAATRVRASLPPALPAPRAAAAAAHASPSFRISATPPPALQPPRPPAFSHVDGGDFIEVGAGGMTPLHLGDAAAHLRDGYGAGASRAGSGPTTLTALATAAPPPSSPAGGEAVGFAGGSSARPSPGAGGTGLVAFGAAPSGAATPIASERRTRSTLPAAAVGGGPLPLYAGGPAPTPQHGMFATSTPTPVRAVRAGHERDRALRLQQIVKGSDPELRGKGRVVGILLYLALCQCAVMVGSFVWSWFLVLQVRQKQGREGCRHACTSTHRPCAGPLLHGHGL